MKPVLMTLALAALLAPFSSASALSLDEAKSQGLVGETTSGYLEAVKPSPEVNALVRDINAKRRAAYQDIAQKNGTATDVVEQVGGKQAIQKARPGTAVKLPSGEWKKK